MAAAPTHPPSYRGLESNRCAENRKLKKCRSQRDALIGFAASIVWRLHNPEKISTNVRVSNGSCLLSMQSARLAVWNRYCSKGRTRNSFHFASEAILVPAIEKE